MSVFDDIVGKVKEIREGNIARRESIARVKIAMKQQENGDAPEQIDAETKALSEKLKVSYKDAVEYLKAEKKDVARKQELSKLLRVAGNIGQAAKADSARRYGSLPGMNKASKSNEPAGDDEITKMNKMAAQMTANRKKMLGMS